MKNYFYVISLLMMVAIIFSNEDITEEQTFKLKDGTIIRGTVLEQNSEIVIVQASYGKITIEKTQIVQKEFEVTLKSGEILKGLKVSETDDEIILKTKLGDLNIMRSEILNLVEIGGIVKNPGLSAEEVNLLYSSSSPFDFLFGSKKRLKNTEFALGEEKLIDTFFDPTGNVLEDGTLYLSGLSFAFGLSERLQISSRWADFFWGNFNIRPKYQIFKTGNWEKESALAVGGHFHTYWQPNKLTWQSGSVDVTEKEEVWNGNSHAVNETVHTVNYGGYFPMGAIVEGNTIDIYSNCHDCDEEGKLMVDETEDLDFMFEFFTAYTFSKARKGMKGRISSTVGALVQIPSGYDEYPYRLFGSLDLDITPQLKIIGEAFYDPFFIDLNNRQRDDDCDSPGECFFGGNYVYETDEASEIIQDDLKSIRPIHFDFGFMYAVNEHFRIGIHNQPYIIAFYWKF